jgi:Xaa-Pro aminopeptidase
VTPTLERAREAMRAAGVDAVLVASPGLVAFLTGHVLPAHLAYPSRDGRLEKPTLALVTQDDAVTIGVDPKPTVGAAVPYGADRRGLADASFGVLAELDLGRRLAAELAWVPAGALAALPELEVRPLDDLLADARAAKSPDEIAGIEAACAVVDAAHAAIRAAVRPGASELELYAEAVGAATGAADELVLMGAEIQAGRRGELMMGAPTSATVEAGELVMSDLYPRHPNGWWADSCSTVACGEPSADQLADWRALSDGLRAGQEALRPGTTAGEVYRAVCRHAGEQPGHVGHGIGRDHYEEPAILPDSPARLPEGAVVVLEPGRYGGGRGMRLEWAFEVTADGGRPLTTFALEL